jgi:hypothetical protein
MSRVTRLTILIKIEQKSMCNLQLSLGQWHKFAANDGKCRIIAQFKSTQMDVKLLDIIQRVTEISTLILTGKKLIKSNNFSK